MTREEILTKLFGPIEPAGIRMVWSPAVDIDAYSSHVQFLKRHLYLFEEIEESVDSAPGSDGTVYLIKAIELFNEISAEPITLFINSPGGDIPNGMALIQTMRNSVAPINTFVMGEAASMAAIVAVAGVKRYAYPAARWLLHRGKFEAKGDYADLRISEQEARINDLTADQVLINWTKIPADRLDKMQVKDKWFGAKQALRWGLVDEIVVPLRSPTPGRDAWLPDQKRLKAKYEDKDDDEKDEEKPSE